MQATRVRPTGITILVVLEAIASMFFILIGLIMIFLIPVIREVMPGEVPVVLPGVALVLVSIPMAAIGLVGFVIAWGLWTGKGWAWTLAFVLAVLGLILGILSLPGGLIGVLLDGLIVWYLWQPHVKAFYGKQAVQAPYQVTISKTPPPPPPPQTGTVIYCTKCGTANALDSKFCRNCGVEIIQSTP